MRPMAEPLVGSFRPGGARNGRDESMTKPRPKAKQPSRGKANLPRLRHLTDAEITGTAPPELVDFSDDFWKGATLVAPLPKRAISLRVDEDVLAWFRTLGPRYQSRMNAILRSYMIHRSRMSA